MHRACCQVGSRPLLHGSPPLPSVSPPSLCLSLRGAGRLHRDVAMTVGRCHRAPCPHSPAPAAPQQVSTHPTRPTALHPLTRRRLLHVIARSGAAAPRRGNPRPRRSTKREAVPKANSQPSTNLPKPQPTCQVSLRGCGLPRRFAPRNDRQKLAACYTSLRNTATYRSAENRESAPLSGALPLRIKQIKERGRKSSKLEGQTRDAAVRDAAHGFRITLRPYDKPYI